jgi:hypothetical protein
MHIGDFNCIQPLPGLTETMEQIAANYWSGSLRTIIEGYPGLKDGGRRTGCLACLGMTGASLTERVPALRRFFVPTSGSLPLWGKGRNE